MLTACHNPFDISYPCYFTNGYKVKVTYVGFFFLSPIITLTNVLLVPSFQYNLIFIHQLLTELNCYILFTTVSFFLQDPSLKRPLEIGRVEHGLYILHSLFVVFDSSVMSLTNVITSQHSYSFASPTSSIDYIPAISNTCNFISINKSDFCYGINEWVIFHLSR